MISRESWLSNLIIPQASVVSEFPGPFEHMVAPRIDQDRESLPTNEWSSTFQGTCAAKRGRRMSEGTSGYAQAA